MINEKTKQCQKSVYHEQEKVFHKVHILKSKQAVGNSCIVYKGEMKTGCQVVRSNNFPSCRRARAGLL